MSKIISKKSGVGGWVNRRKIKIVNFRSLVMDDFLEIKPITLLFGKNGSGKSSFIKAIKFLGDNLFPLNQGPTNFNLDNDIDLGNYQQIVTNNITSKNITIEFEEYWEAYTKYTDTEESRIINYRVKTNINKSEVKSVHISDLHNNLEFEILPNTKNIYDESEVNKIERGQFLNTNVDESISNRLSNIDNIGYCGYPNKTIDVGRRFETNDPQLKNFIKYLDILPFISDPKDLKFSYFNQLLDSLNFDSAKRDDLDLFVKHFINEIPILTKKFFKHFYITPIRVKPKSKYRLVGNNFNSNDYYGILNQIDKSLSSFNKFYPGNDAESNIIEFINRNLKFFDLGTEISIKKENGSGSVFIKDKLGFEYNLSEASSGLIQIFPIIISSFNALYEYSDYVTLFDNSYTTDVVIIEQPELHLHPALQTRLMEFFYQSAGGTYLIETHSEHMVRKLQILIAQKKLSRENVAIYYFDKNSDTGITSIKEMKLDEKGRFVDEWPPGFFDTDTELALEFFREISKN